VYLVLFFARCLVNEQSPYEQEPYCSSVSTVRHVVFLDARRGFCVREEVGEVALVERVGTEPGVPWPCKQLGVLQADTLCARLAKPHAHTPAHTHDAQHVTEGVELPG